MRGLLGDNAKARPKSLQKASALFWSRVRAEAFYISLFFFMTSTDNDIGWAVAAMKNGVAVTRLGWNGKNMYVAIADPFPDPTIARLASSEIPGVPMTLPFAYIRTADGHFIPWVCSQADLLATDWAYAGDGVRECDGGA